jgi:hypothetical protein
MTTPAPVELDARGRRLRAALAAVLVRADAPELRLVREWARQLVRHRAHHRRHPGPTYLYFTNGALTTIQRRRYRIGD